MTGEQDIPAYDVHQEADGSFQVALSNGIDVVYYGGFAHPPFDVTVGKLSGLVSYRNAKSVTHPFRSVLGLESAIEATPVLLPYEAGVHFMKSQASGRL